MSEISVKVCGLRDAASVAACVNAGVRYLGFNFFAKSPRSVTPEEAAALSVDVPPGVAKVALVVNEGDDRLDEIIRQSLPDMIQLHGKEDPARVAEIRARYGLPVMKAIGIAEAEDLAQIDLFSQVSDQLLIDAKAPKGADLPGGNGLAFDWQLLRGRKYWTKPWMLAGGLTADNVAEAVQRTGTRQVDTASGVETAPGIKDPALIRAFVAAAQTVPVPSL